MEDAREEFLALCKADPSVLDVTRGYLTRIPVFEFLKENEIEEILSLLDAYIVHPNEVIFQEGTLGDTLYVVLEGKVLLTARDVDGAARLIAERGKGDSFGEISFLTDSPRSLTAFNHDGETFLLAFQYSYFEELIESRPRIGFSVYSNLVTSIQKRLDPLPRYFQNLVLWGYVPGPISKSVRIRVEDPRLSMPAMLGIAGMMIGLLQFGVILLLLNSSGLLGAISVWKLAVVLLLVTLISTAGCFSVGLHYETFERSLLYRQVHPQSCARCKFVLFDESDGKHGCLFARQPELKTSFRPSLRPDTYTDCPSFEPSQLAVAVQKRKHDDMSKD